MSRKIFSFSRNLPLPLPRSFLSRWLPGSPRPLPDAGEEFELWLKEPRSEREWIRSLGRLPTYLRERAAEHLAREERDWTPALVGALLKDEVHVALALAENPSLQQRESVRLILERCRDVARTYHPEAPFGPFVEWESFRAVRTLLSRGLVDFRHPAIARARKAFSQHPSAEWPRQLVAADPHTPLPLLERAVKKFVRSPALPRNRNAMVQDVLEVWLRRSIGRPGWREDWEVLLEENPAGAARLLQDSTLRLPLEESEFAALLSSPRAELRLSAMLALSARSQAAAAPAPPAATPSR